MQSGEITYNQCAVSAFILALCKINSETLFTTPVISIVYCN